DANEYHYVNVRYRVTNNQTGPNHEMRIFYTKRALPCSGTGYPSDYPFSIPGQSGSVAKPIVKDGNWHVVSFPMHTAPNWNGTITGLRLDYFDPNSGSVGSEMDVDFLTVSKHPMVGQGAT